MANTPIDSMTATFGVGDQTAIKMNVTDSGPSNALSKLIDLQIGGTSKFKVTKEGYVTATNYTGSVSGSVFVKNSPSLVGYNNIIFVTGNDGRQTLRVDGGNFQYDPANKNLNVDGNIYAGTSFETNNLTFTLLSNPQNIVFGSSATDLTIGNSAINTYTKFNSYQVRARHFTGSFTGSISGSNYIKSDASTSAYMDVVFATGPGKQVLKVDPGMFFYDPSNNTLTVDTDIYAGNAFDVIVNTNPSLFATPSNITFGANAGTLTIGNSGTSTYTRFLSDQIRAVHFTGSFTGSINGDRSNFTKLSGSNARIAGRVIATSYTGSISGSVAKFTNLNAKNLTVNTNVTAKSFTGSLSGSVYVKNTNSAPSYLDILFVGSDVFANGPIQTLNVDQAAFSYDPSNKNLYVTNDIYAGNEFDVTGTSSPSLFATPTSITLGAAATSLIIGNSGASSYTKFNSLQTRGNFTGSFTGSITGSTANFSKRVRAANFTGSITGTRGFFTRISSSTAIFTIRANAPSFTGSISGSTGFLTRLSGNTATFRDNIIATSFTGSISGSRSNFNKLSGSFARIKNNVIATSFTGSISGSNGWLRTLTSSNLTVEKTLYSNAFTGSIYSDKSTIINLFTQKITGSFISSSQAAFTVLTASKVKLTSIIANSITASLSGSVYVNLNNTNNDLYVLFTPNSIGQTPLYTDGDLYYNPGSKVLTVQGSVIIDNLIDSTSITTSSLFNSVPTVIIGQNSNLIRIGKTANKIALGTTFTQVILSGSLTGSLARFSRITSSRGRVLDIRGNSASFGLGNYNYISSSRYTGSYVTVNNLTASKAVITKITGSDCKIQNNLSVIEDIELSGSLKFRFPFTGSGPSSHRLFISGAGALQGYMGIMINGTRYKMPLYAWS